MRVRLDPLGEYVNESVNLMLGALPLVAEGSSLGAIYGDGARKSLVQEPLRCGNHRLRVEQVLYRGPSEQVADRQENHPLMMGHPATHQFIILQFLNSRWAKICRFIIAQWPLPAHLLHDPEILEYAGGVDGESKEGRIR